MAFNLKHNVPILSVLLFALLQMLFAVMYNSSIMTLLGIYQLNLIIACIVLFIVCQYISLNNVYILIVLYQVIFVLLLFGIYLFQYNDPLGYSPIDALFYHDIAMGLRDRTLYDSFQYVLRELPPGEVGFLAILQLIYKLPGPYPVFNVKIFNIICHIITCYYIYKITWTLFVNNKIAKLSLILYGINPTSIYFNASGLKEPLFALVVVLSFYCIYKAYVENKYWYYMPGVLYTLYTGLLRVAFPVFFILSFVLYWFLNMKGEFKALKRSFIIIAGIIFLFISYKFVESELSVKLDYDIMAIASHRFGKTPSIVDYIVLTIGGIVGPFPSFNTRIFNDTNVLHTVGNYFKIIMSYFFIVGVYQSYKNRNNIINPMMYTILLNLIPLVALSASLDYRFTYPLIPFFFIIISYGYYNYNRGSNMKVPIIISIPVYYIFTMIVIVLYNIR